MLALAKGINPKQGRGKSESGTLVKGLWRDCPRGILAGADLADRQSRAVARWEMAGASTDRRVYHQRLGALDNDRRMASDYRFRRTRDVHRPPRVLVVGRALYPGRGRRGRFRHRSAGRTDTHQYVSAYSIAPMYARRGEQDRAFESLEKAYRDRAAAELVDLR